MARVGSCRRPRIGPKSAWRAWRSVLLPWPVFGVAAGCATHVAQASRPAGGQSGRALLDLGAPDGQADLPRLGSSTGWPTLHCCVSDLSDRPLSSEVRGRFCWERPSSAPNPTFAGSTAKAQCDLTGKGTGIAPRSGCEVGWIGSTCNGWGSHRTVSGFTSFGPTEGRCADQQDRGLLELPRWCQADRLKLASLQSQRLNIGCTGDQLKLEPTTIGFGGFEALASGSVALNRRFDLRADVRSTDASSAISDPLELRITGPWGEPQWSVDGQIQLPASMGLNTALTLDGQWRTPWLQPEQRPLC